MPLITGRVQTANGSRYLQQLCKHWQHKFDVDFSATKGQIRFAEIRVTLEAKPDALLITAEIDEADSVEKLKDVFMSHLDRFAFREAPLPVEWTATGGGR